MPDQDDVSVVIPTSGTPARRRTLERALASVRAQTAPAAEIIVVFDGADAAAALHAVVTQGGARLVRTGSRRGGGAARNVGVAGASGCWIALLDDDDEWHPDKLARQLDAARAVAGPTVVFHQVEVDGESGDVLPARGPRPDEPLGDYLFCRDGLRLERHVVQTSTLLVPRSLLVAVPFREGLPVHQDWDWLLQLGGSDLDWQLTYVPEPLGRWWLTGTGDGVSRTSRWLDSLSWVRSVRHLLSPEAYGAFLLTFAMTVARRQRSPLGAFALCRESVRAGRVPVRYWIAAILLWISPAGLRRAVSDRLPSARREGGPLRGLS